MSIAYYPGCSGQGTSIEYDASTRAVCRSLGVEVIEIPEWSCCGSTPAHAVSHELSGALSARNLVQAASVGADKVITPCPSCLSNLKAVRFRMGNEEFAGKVKQLLDLDQSQVNYVDNLPDSFSVLQVLVEEIGLEAIKEKVVRPLKGLKVAAYYGCLMSRPADIMKFDDPENPIAMDNVLEALGMEVVPFSLKTECCGAAMGIPKKEVTARLTGRIIETAKNFGADVIAVACPLCHMNLDLRQEQAGAYYNTQFDMPVLYLTQLMGMAFGVSDSELMLDKLCVSPSSLYEKMSAHEEKLAQEAKEAEKKAAEKKAADEAKAKEKAEQEAKA